MSGLIDLHCHFLPGVDDGARSTHEAREMLKGLARLGFGMVVATPHMRPGLFDNTAEALNEAYELLQVTLGGDESSLERQGLPKTHLSCEHYFDDVVLQRIKQQKALPYPGGQAILLEFYDIAFSPMVERQLFELQRRGVVPVIAHPERYRPLWNHPERLERLVDMGCAALLDAAALVGKYGSQVRHSALELLEHDLYDAACSDAHRPSDINDLEQAMTWLRSKFGDEEVLYLFHEGPTRILRGAQGALAESSPENLPT